MSYGIVLFGLYFFYLWIGTPAADDFMPVFVFVIIKVNYDKYYY